MPAIWPGGIQSDFVARWLHALAKRSSVTGSTPGKVSKYFFSRCVADVCTCVADVCTCVADVYMCCAEAEDVDR